MRDKLMSEVYKNAIYEANDIIFILSESGEIIDANNRAITTYDYTKEEFLAMSIFDLRGKENRDNILKQFDIAKREGIELQTIHYRKDKSSFPVEVKSIGVDIDGEKIVVSIIRDISYRIKVHEEMRLLASIVENSEEAIISKSLDGIITSWNKGAEKLYGYTKDEAIGKHIFLIIPEENNKEYYFFMDSIVKGEKIRHYETVRKNKTGEIVSVSISMSPIYDSQGKLMGVSNTTRDITEKKLKEIELSEKYEELTMVYEELIAAEEELKSNYKELEKSKEEVEKANLAKDKFLANMSHEIRTPLNGIMGITDLISYTELSEEQKEYIKMIKESSKALLSIVNDLLDISKIESGKFELNKKCFNIKENLDRLIKEFSFICSNKNLDFFYYIDPLIPQELIGDELRMNQILINIMNNAVKYTERGRIILKINKASQRNEKITVKFTVSDTGIGIKEEFKKDIFNAFSQQDVSYNKNYSGTGLGLSITKELVKQMNGEVWFESQEGEGSTFYISLDFMINPTKANKDVEKFATCTPMLSKDKMILVVEDNIINMRIITEMIEKLGYKFKSAYSGKEALELLKEFYPDLIFMDIQMPGLNGFETTVKIRGDEAYTDKHVPIVAMTAYAMIGDRELCINSGMDDYMAKPFDINKLREVIDNNLNKRVN